MRMIFRIEDGREFDNFDNARKAELKTITDKLTQVVDTECPGMDSKHKEMMLAMLTSNSIILTSLLKQYAIVDSRSINDVMRLDDLDDLDGTET